MNCRDINPHLSELIDGELSIDLRQRVEDHLKTCNECSGLLESMKSLSSLYGISPAPASVKSKVMSSIKEQSSMSFFNRLASYFSVNRENVLAVSVVLVTFLLFGLIVSLRGGAGLSGLHSYSDNGEAHKQRMTTDALREEKQSEASRTKTNQKIIRTANVAIEIKRGTAQRKLWDVIDITESQGGYVVDSDISKNGGGSRAMAVIRVPEKSLKDVVLAIHRLGAVKRSAQSGRDVTDEYMDLDTRINQLKAEESAYRRLYERASKIIDLIQIQEKISGVQTNIEQLQGQFNSLSEKVNFATVDVRLAEPKKQKKAGLIELWKKSKAFEIGMSGLVAISSFIVISAITILPLILLVLASALIWRMIIRKV